MNIRTAVFADLTQIKIIDAESFGENVYPLFVLRQLLDISGGLMKVAVVDEKVIGYAIGHYNQEKSESWFLSLGVLIDHRGKKIGENLTKALLDEVKAKKARKVKLTVDPENKKGISIYKRLGFKEEQFEEDYYHDNTPRMIMSMLLNYN